MRKLLIVSLVGLIPSFGCCETVRRIEVWKLQTFFSPNQPVMLAPATSAPCGASVAPADPCTCPPSAVPGTVSAAPAAVSTSYPSDTGEAASTEELDGVLKQP